MTVSNDDQSLIDACRAGKTDAFGVLVRRYQDRLYPTALRLTGGADDAADLLQETFLRAYEKLHTFHGDSGFFTWVYRIAVNLALSDRRRRKPAARLDSGQDSGSANTVDPRETDPTLPLERAERERIVQDALNSLAPDHRVIVVLKEFEGLRYEEIAGVLNVPVGTVRSRLHRARCELKARLARLIEHDEGARQTVPDPH